MADAWVQFARTGDPNHAGLPNWQALSSTDVPSMIFDNDCRLVSSPDKEEQASI